MGLSGQQGDASDVTGAAGEEACCGEVATGDLGVAPSSAGWHCASLTDCRKAPMRSMARAEKSPAVQVEKHLIASSGGQQTPNDA